MFTGIIRWMGTVVELEHKHECYRLRLELPPDLLRSLKPGESLAVDGVCLTVQEMTGSDVYFDVVPETIERTTIKTWYPGRKVNCELPLRFEDFLSGHLILGHIDGTTTLLHKATFEESEEHEYALPENWRPFIAEKGSVALNGVSLTVARCTRTSFTIALIPETLARTNLGLLRPGDSVNVEFDVLARYTYHGMKVYLEMKEKEER